ncbi:NAD(P)-dependent dehydrogenase (short-subunit alcohol dehydrogenase family) [Paraburkholderia sp. WSM4175]|uniref:SDR family NAD(P)-dependent oxidoreductase n=1 Tax=Paraburkholderia sp. WSM4175 TaxID=2991072 RepID=UPI003D1E8810
MHTRWTTDDIAPQTGKRVLITGANSGIGYQAALTLTRKGARVILACRDKRRAEKALARLKAEVPGASAELAILDLASLASVRSFAQKELAEQRRIEDYDLILLDVMLPELDGLEVLKRSRTKPSGSSPLKQRRWR